jgi:hypothetical protein
MFQNKQEEQYISSLTCRTEEEMAQTNDTPSLHNSQNAMSNVSKHFICVTLVEIVRKPVCCTQTRLPAQCNLQNSVKEDSACIIFWNSNKTPEMVLLYGSKYKTD